MIHKAIRSAVTLARSSLLIPTYHGTYLFSPLLPSSSSAVPFASVHGGTNAQNATSVANQMINCALAHARSQKSDESYGQGMLMLEQCLSFHSSEDQSAQNSRGMVLLAMSDMLYERGSFSEAIDRLQGVLDLTQSSLGVRVAAMEALIALYMQLEQDDTSSVLADQCLEMLENDQPKAGNGSSQLFSARAKALKGLVELVNGNVQSAGSFFQGLEDCGGCTGHVALSFGQFLHATQNVSLAKELYQKVIQGVAVNDFTDINALAVCNMTSEEVMLAAMFALGQLESHGGNFADAEEILTKALTKTEEHFGQYHPKVGVVLTAIALMFRHKARKEHSSSLLIQEGLYRRAIELLKAPSIESEETKVARRDMVALARGGYAELLCVQENRKVEGEKMKRWAETAWRNSRMSLDEALNFSEPSNKCPVVDGRTSRVI